MTARRTIRVIAAMLLAPAVGMILLWALVFASFRLMPNEPAIPLAQIVSGALGATAISALLLYPLAWMFGLPAHFLLVRRGMTAYRHYALAGVGLGLFAAVLLLMTGDKLTPAVGFVVAPVVALVGRAIVGPG